MAATYTGDPGASSLDEVRFLMGDTRAPYRLSDAEVNWLISEVDDDALVAAASGAHAVAAQAADEIDRSIGDVSRSYSQIARQFADRATKLDARVKARDEAQAAAPSVPVPFFGGAEREPYFGEDMHSSAPLDDRRYG